MNKNNKNLIYAFVYVLILIGTPSLHALISSIAITNNTGEAIKVRITAESGEQFFDLIPKQRNSTAAMPHNMTVYMTNGSTSEFSNIAMNPTLFKDISITKSGNCAVLHYTGIMRTHSVRKISPITIEPDAKGCKTRGWNPANGYVFMETFVKQIP